MFLKTMHFEKCDGAPIWQVIGFWNETIERWLKEGLPVKIAEMAKQSSTIHCPEEICDYFKMNRREKVSVNLGMLPAFEPQVLEEDEDTRIAINNEGVTYREVKKGTSVPQFLEFPVENMEDWAKIKDRYQYDAKGRYPDNWDYLVRMYRERDCPLSIAVNGFFGGLRKLMGDENLMLAYYDQPELINDMSDFFLDFYVKVLDKAVSEIEIDFCIVWEDMCYRNGPMVSPQIFRKFILPYYRKNYRFF